MSTEQTIGVIQKAVTEQRHRSQMFWQATGRVAGNDVILTAVGSTPDEALARLESEADELNRIILSGGGE